MMDTVRVAGRLVKRMAWTPLARQRGGWRSPPRPLVRSWRGDLSAARNGVSSHADGKQWVVAHSLARPLNHRASSTGDRSPRGRDQCPCFPFSFLCLFLRRFRLCLRGCCRGDGGEGDGEGEGECWAMKLAMLSALTSV
jgi:hypothetical protein